MDREKTDLLSISGGGQPVERVALWRRLAQASPTQRALVLETRARMVGAVEGMGAFRKYHRHSRISKLISVAVPRARDISRFTDERKATPDSCGCFQFLLTRKMDERPENLLQESGLRAVRLLHYIDIGDIGLPDIQRPFVWSNAKVRDLFDSMYRGFPVGYFFFWENAAGDGGAKKIGVGQKNSTPYRRG